jgi:hypothetical protein
MEWWIAWQRAWKADRKADVGLGRPGQGDKKKAPLLRGQRGMVVGGCDEARIQESTGWIVWGEGS